MVPWSWVWGGLASPLAGFGGRWGVVWSLLFLLLCPFFVVSVRLAVRWPLLAGRSVGLGARRRAGLPFFVFRRLRLRRRSLRFGPCACLLVLRRPCAGPGRVAGRFLCRLLAPGPVSVAPLVWGSCRCRRWLLVANPPLPPGLVVGLGGSRSLPPSCAPLVSAVVSAVAASGRGVACSCCAGASALVRAAAPGASVFSVASGRWGRGAFAARAAALVRASTAGWVAFVAGPCPAGLVPSASSSRCWGGFGSGSWSESAFAVGLGLPVVVFWCGPGAAALPPWPGGAWAPAAASGVWAGGWRWVPAPAVAARLPGF